ncbi:MAG: SDR family NAD(P)-dependent oxidoreductase [Crocinitomicaceae bacterium]
MRYFFLTGDSSGIGAELKGTILKNECNFLYGLSRRGRKSTERFNAISIDLSQSEQVKTFNFPNLIQPSEVILINNAATIGSIQPLFEQDFESIQNVFQTNTITVAILISKFLKKYSKYNLTIINISSGAAQNPIQGWSTYCASKSALEMLTRTLIEDLKFKKMNNVRVFSVSPGVIDTQMQQEIRSSNPSSFALHEKFTDLKKNGELIPPKRTADLVYKIIEEPKFYSSPFINLREFY